MAIVLAGDRAVSNADSSGWSTPFDWSGHGGGHPLDHFFRGCGYEQLYRRQPSVFTVASKLAELQSTLPLKVYRRTRKGREVATTSQYGQLLAQPSTRMSAHDWRLWMASTFQVFGEAFAFKVRDELGRPVELAPIHPTRVRYGEANGGRLIRGSEHATPAEHTSDDRWWFIAGDGVEVQVWRRDLVVWRSYNPASMHRGLSKLEPLRDALENDAAAQAAMEALWKQGGRPSFVLTHPGTLGSSNTTRRLAEQWAQRHGGVSNWHKPLIIEEGLTPHPIALDDGLQYLETRKLTDAQVAKVFKLNPAAIGDLERATFNNITEILRDVYRSTMPPILDSFEAALAFDVRDGRHGDDDRQPDFGPAFYAEHELDGVMRGDFEARAEAYAKGIQNGWLTPAEVREMENRSFMEGTDRAFINGAVVPIEEASRTASTAQPPAQESLGSSTEAAASMAPTVMGRLSRPKALSDVDVDRLGEGMAITSALALRGAVSKVADDGGGVADLRSLIRELELR